VHVLVSKQGSKAAIQVEKRELMRVAGLSRR
jgi:hypothetical protein